MLIHKWKVFIECCKLGIPLRGLLHDCGKFLPCEWFPYARHFYGDRHGETYGASYFFLLQKYDHEYVSTHFNVNSKFDIAWNHHLKRNEHHWQYWVLSQKDNSTIVLPMPDKARKEMLADWRAMGGKVTRNWYMRHKDDIILHPSTRKWIEAELKI